MQKILLEKNLAPNIPSHSEMQRSTLWQYNQIDQDVEQLREKVKKKERKFDKLVAKYRSLKAELLELK